MKKTVTVRMDEALHRRLKTHAAIQGKTLESVIVRALTKALPRSEQEALNAKV